MPKASRDQLTEIDYNGGTSRIWNGDDFVGTAVLYAATEDDHTAFIGDFEIASLEETRPCETRASRERRRSHGPVKPLPENRLHHELIVVFGAEMSAKNAEKALLRLAREIRKNGLMIGRDEDDEFLMEQIDGCIV